MSRFEFRFDPRYARASRVFGVTPERAWVEVDDGRVRARFGRWGLETPLANVKAVSTTGPYLFVKAAGPARMAATDSGLTFASNGERGVLIEFHEKVRSRGPYALRKHCELTVTPADVDGLVAALAAR